MINRYYKDGQRLDVAGLNEITVLLDRSETEILEIGWNCWRPDLDGPPHKHNDKDQIFYVTNGKGKVILDKKEYAVNPGCLIYVPAGMVHQTITSGNISLCYLLFNIFISTEKEGHSSFADHIEKVKQLRKRQAESGNAFLSGEETTADSKKEKYFTDVKSGKISEMEAMTKILLLKKNETGRFELEFIEWHRGKTSKTFTYSDREKVLFVLEGEGEITVNGVKELIKPGHLVFIPRNKDHSIRVMNKGLSYLCLNGLVV